MVLAGEDCRQELSKTMYTWTLATLQLPFDQNTKFLSQPAVDLHLLFGRRRSQKMMKDSNPQQHVGRGMSQSYLKKTWDI